MSLSRILNDDPPPPSTPSYNSNTSRDHPSLESSAHHQHRPFQSLEHDQNGFHQDFSYLPLRQLHQVLSPTIYKLSFPSGPNPAHLEVAIERNRYPSHEESNNTLRQRHTEMEEFPRKRRKGGEEDQDYQPPVHRRVSFFFLSFFSSPKCLKWILRSVPHASMPRNLNIPKS